MLDRTCPVCTERMPEGSSARALYCSPKCQKWAGNHLGKRICSLDGCNRPHRARGLCSPHYNERLAVGWHVKREVPCAACGVLVMKDSSSSRARRPVCSDRCRAFLTWGKWPASKDLVPAPWIAKKTRPVVEFRSLKRVFIQGACGRCGEQFMAVNPLGGTTSRFCCARRKFSPPRSQRSRIYERDGWVCQLCMEPVNPLLDVADNWSATLDHIVPQSRQVIPDHSDENLRLAHRWCNSVRGDETYYTAADLVA